MFETFTIDPFSPDVLWIVIVGYLIAFVMAFGLGANDVANAFGTSVGSKVLSVRNACIVATIAEISGAVLLGAKVSDTMRKGILDITTYEGAEKELMLGCLASLVGASVWMLIATAMKLPVSATHSTVGATVGFSLVARGSEGLQWGKVGQIAASWVVSPVLSGVISALIYLLINKFILTAKQPMVQGLYALPFIYGVTVLVNVFSVVYEGPPLLHLQDLLWWIALLISLGTGFVIGALVHFFLCPHLRKKCLAASDLDMKTNHGGSENKGFVISETNHKVNNNTDLEMTPQEVATDQPLSAARLSDVADTQTPAATSDLDMKTNHGGSVNKGFVISETNHKVNINTDIEMTPQEVATDQPLSAARLSDAADVTQTSAPANGFCVNAVDQPALESAPPKTKATGIHGARDDDPPEIASLFTFLQIMTATFTSFVHGGNDVSNAIGPLTAIWLIYQEGSVSQKAATPLYILAFGGIGISVGLWVWGRKVMKTIGTDLSKIVPSTGFTIEIGAAITVLIASNVGLPISTTHCLVGSVVIVGRVASSAEGVNWRLFRNIVFAWLVTLPMAGGISALIMLLLRAVAL